MEKLDGSLAGYLNTVAADWDRTSRRGEAEFDTFSFPEARLAEELWRLELRPEQQHAIGPYDCDFFFPDANLDVEVDGKQHEQRRERDARRDAYLEEQGVLTLRFPASEVLADPVNVAHTVLSYVRARRG